MSKRRAEAQEWSSHQIELEQLYVAENMSLQGVMKHMSTKRNFHKSKAQYERVFFKEWKFKKKNISQEEWKYIAYRLRERDANQLHSEIEIRGELVPHSKIEKQRRRYELSIIERLAIEHDPSQRPRTPPGVRIFTPRTPSPVIGPNNTVLWEPVAIQVPFEAYQIEEASASTPWRQFTRNISQLIHCSRAESSSPTSITQHGAILPSFGVSCQHTQTVLTISSRFEHTFQDLMFLQFLDIDLLRSLDENASFCIPSPAFFDPNPYIPLTQSQSPDITIEGISDLTRKDGQVDMIKHAVALLSNNHDIDLIAKLVIELCTDHTNLAFLGRLLRHKHFTITAFAENLFWPALQSKAYKLVENLLDSGVSVNRISPDGDFTMLSTALAKGDETLFSMFMEHNADIQEGGYPLYESLLDKRNHRFLYHLLEMESTPGTKLINVTEKGVIQLARDGRFEIMQYFMSRRPEIFVSLKASPFKLYEAVASSYQKDEGSYMKSMEEIFNMFEILQQSGFDIRAKESLDVETPLSISELPHDIELMRYYLQLGINVNALSLYRPFTFDGQFGKQPSTALVQAVASGDSEMVQLLIENGANVNKPGPVYPIQVAVIFRRLKILRLILEAGADPNSFVMEAFNIDQDRSRCRFHALYPAIQLALIVGSEEVFDILMECQVDIGVKGVCISDTTGLYWKDKSEKLQSCKSQQIKSKQETVLDHACTCVRQGISWNPLLNAALGRNATLFHRVLKMPQSEKYFTRDCLIHCIDMLDWSTVLYLTKVPHFPSDLLNSCQILAASIHANDIEFTAWCIKSDMMNKGTGNICLAYATVLGRVSVIKLFLQSGFWPDDPIDLVPKYPLGCGRMIDYLDKFNGMNALEHALRGGYEHDIQDIYAKHYDQLLDQDFDIELLPRLQTAYGLAIQYGQLEFLKRMQYHILRLPFNYKTNRIRGFSWRLSPIEAVCQFNSPIQMAAALGKFKIVEWLLDQNLDHQDDDIYHSTLQLAIRDQQEQLAQRLLERGADVNAKPFWQFGATALQFAAVNGNFKLLNFLLSKGANSNAPPAYLEGRTALEGASESGRLDMVSYLLNLGADVRGKYNSNYRRAVYRASMHGHHTLARMIQDWKASKYGLEDCDSIESIVESADLRLLGYGDGVDFFGKYKMIVFTFCVCTKRWRDEYQKKRYQERE